MQLPESLSSQAPGLIAGLPNPPQLSDGRTIRTFTEINAAGAAIDQRGADRVLPGETMPRELAELLPIYAEFAIEDAALSNLAEAVRQAEEGNPVPLNDSFLARADRASVDDSREEGDPIVDAETLALFRQIIEDAIRDVVGDDDKLVRAHFEHGLPKYADLVENTMRQLIGRKMVEDAVEMIDGDADLDTDDGLGSDEADLDAPPAEFDVEAFMAELHRLESEPVNNSALVAQILEELEELQELNRDLPDELARSLEMHPLRLADAAEHTELAMTEKALLSAWEEHLAGEGIRIPRHEIVSAVNQLSTWAADAGVDRGPAKGGGISRGATD